MAKTKRNASNSDKNHAEESRPVHSGPTPNADPVIDLGTRKLLEEQAAERAVRSGAIDDAGVWAGETPLLRDRGIDADVQVQRSAVRQRAVEAQRIGSSLVEDAIDGSFTPGSRAATGSRAETRSQKRAKKKELALARAEATKLAAVLGGAERAADGGRWVGAPIAAATPDAARRVLRRHRWTIVLLIAGLLGIEGIVTAGSLYSFLRSSDWLQASMIAVTALVSLTVGPLLLGQSLARWRVGAQRGAAALLGIVPIGIVWLTVGVTLACVRVSSEMQAYATQQSSQFQTLNGGGVIGAAPAAVSTGYQIDAPLAVAFWTAVLLGLGVVAGTYEMVTFNPVKVRELEARMLVWQLDAEFVELDGRLDRIRRRVRHQRLDVKLTERMWAEELTAVGARAELLKWVFSEAISLAAGTPEMTEAMEDRTARTRTAPVLSTVGPHASRAPHAVVPMSTGRTTEQKDVS